MSMRIQVEVWENRQRKEASEFEGSVELGRQRDREEGLFSRKQENGGWRWVIARRDETTVGRNQIILTPLADGRVRVTNGSDKQPIRFLDRPDLQPKDSCDAPLPLHVILGPTKTVHVKRSGPDKPLQSLAEHTLPPRSAPAPGSRFPSLVMPYINRESAREVIQWLHGMLEVLQAVAESTNFLDRAARAVVEAIGLDAARALVLQDGTWRVQTTQTATGVDPSYLRPPSASVLERMRTEQRTFWELPGESSASESLAGLETVVAAPILDKEGHVIGALYGERKRMLRPGQASISEPEAMLIELLARAVATGLALQEEERKAVSARVQFEQFFTPDLARQLADMPDMLEGRDRDVTVMFCDIRGFSRISHDLGAARTILWCRDVLDLLSGCVLENGGVLVDYVGDGLMAMWGAPEEQPDHASRACRAALAILEQLPQLNARWQATLGEPMKIGIGINTGTAQVGNVGSRFKFKYGALGNTVNLASRVQGATKYFKTTALITGATVAQLDHTFMTRRLGQARVIGIDTPVQLYELFSPDCSYACRAREEYDKALTQFEQKEFGAAARTLGNWRGECPGDDPVLVLMYRAVKAMVEGEPSSHPVFELTEKGN